MGKFLLLLTTMSRETSSAVYSAATDSTSLNSSKALPIKLAAARVTACARFFQKIRDMEREQANNCCESVAGRFLMLQRPDSGVSIGTDPDFHIHPVITGFP